MPLGVGSPLMSPSLNLPCALENCPGRVAAAMDCGANTVAAVNDPAAVTN
jgi:hypothetical protein